MDGYSSFSSTTHDVELPIGFDPEDDVKKGPWTVEEDNILMEFIKSHGEGRWSSLAGNSGLKRSGKSCRLRWLNYLRPNVRRGNITLQEQLLILQLHSRWGNRWSKIAEFLPGRTDNEIKNYWRTRVQKQAKQLNCDVNSKQFHDAMHYVWIPRLMERIHASKTSESTSDHITAVPTAPVWTSFTPKSDGYRLSDKTHKSTTEAAESTYDLPEASATSSVTTEFHDCWNIPEHISCVDQFSELNYCPTNELHYSSTDNYGFGSFQKYGLEQMESSNSWSTADEDLVENLWNDENIWFLRQQLNSD